MNLLKVFFLLLLTVTSCCSMPAIPSKDRPFYNLLNVIAQKITLKFDVYPCGNGFENDDSGKLNVITLSFITNHLYSKEVARALLLESATLFLNEINNSNIDQNKFSHFPLTLNNIEVAFFILTKEQQEPVHPQISTFYLYKGMMHYNTIDPIGKLQYHSKEKETLEEALTILEGQKLEPQE